MECNSLATPTFIWVDDKHLLTQRGNGHLVIVDVNGKAQPLVTIPNVEAPVCGPDLLRDGENQIYYQEIQRAWRIDIAKRTFEPYLWEASGNDFDMEYQLNTSYGHVIRYRGGEIGRWWCESANTAPGYISVEFGPVGSNLGYPEGVKVWSAEDGMWTTITGVTFIWISVTAAHSPASLNASICGLGMLRLRPPSSGSWLICTIRSR